MEDLEKRVDDHEDRIRVLETNSTILITKLNLMIGILAAIAAMVGGTIVAKIF